MLDSNKTISAQRQFEMLCDGLEDYEHLPEYSAGLSELTPAFTETDHEDSINAEILAGLVRP